MPESQHTRNGKEVVLTTNGNPSLTVGGQAFEVVKHAEAGTWWTPALAFREFDSLEELADALADSLPTE